MIRASRHDLLCWLGCDAACELNLEIGDIFCLFQGVAKLSLSRAMSGQEFGWCRRQCVPAAFTTKKFIRRGA